MSYTVTMTEQGQVMQRLVMSVRNSAKQYVRVFLPSEGHEIWSAAVAGKSVKPATDGAAIMIPLKKDGGRQDACIVELVWVEPARPALGARGLADLVFPRVDLPVAKLFATVWLPDEYRYGEFVGDLKECPSFSSCEPNPNVVPEPELAMAFDSINANFARRDSVCRRDSESDVDGDDDDGLCRKEMMAYDMPRMAAKKGGPSLSFAKSSMAPPPPPVKMMQLQQHGGARGRAGVVPVRVDMVTAGRCFRFERLLLAPEEPAMKLSVPYTRKSDREIQGRS